MSQEDVAMVREFVASFEGPAKEDMQRFVVEALGLELYTRGQELRTRRAELRSELDVVEKDLDIIDNELGPPVGLTLKSLLHESGITQAAIAQEFEVSLPTMVRFLHAQTVPGPSKLCRPIIEKLKRQGNLSDEQADYLMDRYRAEYASAKASAARRRRETIK